MKYVAKEADANEDKKKLLKLLVSGSKDSWKGMVYLFELEPTKNRDRQLKDRAL